ncbi:MAG TPA: chitobiase/beta-hexosaminidase C-terminal domain-containing protein [Steroidobacteraceae bacterium]|nr:chitobiase/beta-hexosaminidase C-terminal domain-containing protein [Steroidobacteraceae bacterium]
MPETAAGKLPPLLSQTGAFADLRTLAPAPGLLPYDLVLAFWSDGAVKTRFVAIPAGKVKFSATGEWIFPPGTVFVKTFELPVDAAQPQHKRRLETRLLVVDRNGTVYGVDYKWRADLSEADLLPASATEDIAIRDAAGHAHTQTWYYPSRKDCTTCHNSHTAGQLGPKTRQMNRDVHYPDGITENQLRYWNRLGLFEPALDDRQIASLPALARPDDTSRSLEDRARSYLDANCAHCHRPGGTVASFDARYDTPLAQQNIVDGPVLIDEGVDRARVVSPHDPWRSIMLMRVDTNDDRRMPPLARQTIDTAGVALLRAWIDSMPGRDVLAPPAIMPAGGSFSGPVTVTLSSSEAGAEIHYTLDGSAPGLDDPVYRQPVRVEGPAVLRARAYKDGFTRSVIAQQTYVIGQ